jgi:hypothetical protein
VAKEMENEPSSCSHVRLFPVPRCTTLWRWPPTNCSALATAGSCTHPRWSASSNWPRYTVKKEEEEEEEEEEEDDDKGNAEEEEEKEERKERKERTRISGVMCGAMTRWWFVPLPPAHSSVRYPVTPARSPLPFAMVTTHPPSSCFRITSSVSLLFSPCFPPSPL